MAGAPAFLEGWRRLVEDPGTGAVILDVLPSDELGELRGAVFFEDGYSLDVGLLLRFVTAPELERYSLQLLSPSKLPILRYDNSPVPLQSARRTPPSPSER